MNSSILIGLFVAGFVGQQTPPATTPAPAPAAQEKPVSGNLKLRIATSTYLTDGRVLTASASDWPLALNKLVTVHAVTGKTLCEPRPGTLDLPADAGSGWRLQITPLRESAGELEVGVHWRQISPGQVDFVRPVLAKNRTVGVPTTTLKLHPGDRIVLDYAPVREWTTAFFAKSPAGAKQLRLSSPATAADAGSCNAVGMSLEIGLEPTKTGAIVEAELWLVRPNRDGTEQSERQVLRLPVGQPPSAYAFDEARLLREPLPAKFPIPFAKVFGDVAALSVGDGKIHLKFNLTRKYESGRREPPPDWTTNSTYRDLVAVPGEVLAFQLPTIDVPVIATSFPDGVQARPKQSIESRPLAQLSVRLRAQVVR